MGWPKNVELTRTSVRCTHKSNSLLFVFNSNHQGDTVRRYSVKGRVWTEYEIDLSPTNIFFKSNSGGAWHVTNAGNCWAARCQSRQQHTKHSLFKSFFFRQVCHHLHKKACAKNRKTGRTNHMQNHICVCWPLEELRSIDVRQGYMYYCQITHTQTQTCSN